jgi:hypothetical protein
MIFVADFETTAKTQFLNEQRTRVYLFEFKSLDNTIKFVGTSIELFFYYLETLEKNLTVYFHNLSFDGEFILWYLIENGFVFYNGEDKREKTFQNITTDMGQHYLIKVILTNGYKVEFKCSYRLMPISIEKIGSLVGVKKLKENHNYEEIKNYETLADVPDEELQYLENDVEILRLLILKLKDMNISQMTMSSSSYSNWTKTQYNFSKTLKKSNDTYINEVINFSYKGGITKVNKEFIGVELNDVISYDVNSLYPSQMLMNTMPVGEPLVYNNLKDAKILKTNKKFIVVVYVINMKIIDGHHSFIGLSSGFSFSSYKYDDEILDRTLHLWEEEFNLFIDYYQGEYEVIHVLAFKEQHDVFTSYLNGWKEIKETTQDQVERQIAKLMMNSLYGKFGQKDKRMSKKLRGADDKTLLYEIVEEDAPYKFRPIASYITAMSRCVLIKAIQENAEHFVYCDTDSLYLKDIKEAKNIPISNNVIGHWKFESHYTRFKCLKAKCYIKTKDDGQVIRSIAGLPKEAQELVNYENLSSGLVLKGVKKYMARVKGGIVIDTTDFSINIEATYEPTD